MNVFKKLWQMKIEQLKDFKIIKSLIWLMNMYKWFPWLSRLPLRNLPDHVKEIILMQFYTFSIKNSLMIEKRLSNFGTNLKVA